VRRSSILTVAIVLGCGGGGDDGGGVTPPPTGTLGSIVASPLSISINAGQRQTITMQALNTGNEPIAGATGYSFSSGSPNIAVVSTTGVVTGLSAGQSTITVVLTLNGVTKQTTVPVTVAGTLPSTATVAAGSQTDDFQPPFVAVARGGTVTWTFGDRQHNVEFGSVQGAPANIPNSTPNTSVGRQFNTSGSFGYTCTLHANMNGTVLVP
jgi:plastocyanin